VGLESLAEAGERHEAKHKRRLQGGSGTVATDFSRANAGDGDLRRADREGTFLSDEKLYT